ncbi:MAG: multicopper oxidase family protein [Paludibacter sp.]|nr:multicopper oxidase family protein [Paludibacter sp.]
MKTNIVVSSCVLIFTVLFSACDTNEDLVVNVNEGDFTTILPSPPITNSKTSLTAQWTTQTIFKGKLSNVLGYQSGSILGPTMVVNSGDSIKVKLKNNLDEPTNIHWHGLIAPANMDGHPEDVIQPGSLFDYAFKVFQRGGLYWYHPHPDGHTAKQAYLGLAGAIIVRDAEENTLNLPSGEFEVPLVIQDKRINADYSLDYSPSMNDVMTGYMGQYITVNGVHSPYKGVKTTTYRFRILNGSNGRIYNLGFSNGATFKVIGSDGGLLETAETVSTLLLGPGERVDILMDFSSYPVGKEIFLINNQFSAGTSQGKQKFNIVKFIVDTKATENYSTPANLSIIDKIGTTISYKTRNFDISNMNMSGMSMTGMHRINNKIYDKNRIDEVVAAGSTEIWVFDNSTGDEPHPMHIHGVQFQVLDRTGGRSKLIASEKGWKDTILLLPGEKVRVIMTFSNNKGLFMLHCHNLEHEDDGMMLQFEVK